MNPRTREPSTLEELLVTRFEAAVDEESGHGWPVLIFALRNRTLRKATPMREVQVSCVDVLQPKVASVIFLKGGDPAAPSDTATLLRLHPSREPLRGRRPPCG